jgi:hypothetical protein
MAERRTAGVVLGGLAFIAVICFWVLPYIIFKSTHTLSFKNCSVEFKYYAAVDTADDGYRLAKSKLALCLCNAYPHEKDSTTGKQIMKLHKQYGNSVAPDSTLYYKYNKLDSIVKYRKMAFDTVLALD